jgi:hypothetical protein
LITVGEINPERDASELLIVKNVDVLWRLRVVIVSVWGFIPAQDAVMNLKGGYIIFVDLRMVVQFMMTPLILIIRNSGPTVNHLFEINFSSWFALGWI